jgi:hypothetical protein
LGYKIFGISRDKIKASLEVVQFLIFGAVIIKQAKKDVERRKKTIKIGEIFMFYHLKPWQS